jgi:hypothetical protein
MLIQLITASAYPLYIYIYINSPKRRRFKLCISYIYIRLIGCIAFSCNAWAKRQK